MSLEEFLAVAFQALLPVAAALVSLMAHQATQWLKSKTSNEYFGGALERLNDAVSAAVKETQQTMADEIKDAAEDGKITKEEAEEIKAAAVKAAHAYIGKKGMLELERVVDKEAIERMIAAKIEAFLHDRKLDVLPLPNGSALPVETDDEEGEDE